MLTLVLIPVSNIVEVENTCIIIILSGEDDIIQISRMCIGDRVTYNAIR